MTSIDLNNKTILITGAAGFIGSKLALELLKTQSSVNIIGIDNMNDYYDVSIKEWRLACIERAAAEQIGSALNGPDFNQFLQRCLRQTVDIHGIPGSKMGKALNLFGGAILTDTKQHFRIRFFFTTGGAAAAGTGIRNLQGIAAG